LIFGILGGVLISVITGIVALGKTKDGRQSGRGMAIAGLVLSGVWIVVIGIAIALVALSDTDIVTADRLQVGTCLTAIPQDGARVVTVDTVTCDKPHRGEVFGAINLPDGEFPGQSAIEKYQERCAPALTAYAPDAAADHTIGLYVLYPTPETWKTGDREVTCIATSETELTGSLRG